MIFRGVRFRFRMLQPDLPAFAFGSISLGPQFAAKLDEVMQGAKFIESLGDLVDGIALSKAVVSGQVAWSKGQLNEEARGRALRFNR